MSNQQFHLCSSLWENEGEEELRRGCCVGLNLICGFLPVEPLPVYVKCFTLKRYNQECVDKEFLLRKFIMLSYAVKNMSTASNKQVNIE